MRIKLTVFFALFTLGVYAQSLSAILNPAAARNLKYGELFRSNALPAKYNLVENAAEVTIPATVWSVDGSAYKPGDRIILAPNSLGERYDIQFKGLRGTRDNPIVVTATSKLSIKGKVNGGRVVVFSDCQYVKFTGTEDRLIDISGGGQAVDFRDLSTGVEACYLHIHDVGYSGINVKTDPTCDPKTWRENFVLRDVYIHHNVIENLTDGEGMYVGESHYHSTFPLSCGTVTSAKEHSIIGARIEYNTLRKIGADAIQVGSAIQDCLIQYNYIEDFGTKRVLVAGKMVPVYGQSSGIQANPGTLATIQYNTINGGSSFGIILQGRYGCTVAYNLVKNTVGALFTVAREGGTGSFKVFNNTFVEITGTYGTETYSNTDFTNNVLQMKTGALSKVWGGTFSKTGSYMVVGESSTIGFDTNYVPVATSKVPVGVGYKQYVKPEPPKPVDFTGSLIVRDSVGIKKIFIQYDNGKLIRLK